MSNPRCVRTLLLRKVAITDVLIICYAAFLAEVDEMLQVVCPSNVDILTVGDHFIDNALEETVNLFRTEPVT